MKPKLNLRFSGRRQPYTSSTALSTRLRQLLFTLISYTLLSSAFAAARAIVV